MRRGVGWFWRRGWQLVLQAVGADTTVDPAESSFSFDDYDITANSSSTATGSIVARNAAGDPLANKTVTLAIETIAVSAANSIVTCTTTELLNDGVESAVLTVAARDASDRPIPDIPASDIVFASSGTGNTLTQPASATGSAGTSSGSMVSTVAQAKTITCTVRGTLITDTATATFSAAPAAGTFSNEPVGFTMVADWDNEATISAGGVTLDGAPNSTTGGTHERVTSSIPAGQAFGGAAVFRSYTRGGKRGGYDPGRMQVTMPASTNEMFMGTEVYFPTDYPHTTNGGGGKQWFVTFGGGGRYFLNVDINPSWSNGYYDIYIGSSWVDRGSVLCASGSWQKIEWHVKRVSAGSDEMYLWVDGTLAYSNTAMTHPSGDMALVYDDGSNNGNFTSPVTYECSVTGASGTFSPSTQETVSWTGGTGILQQTTPASGVTPTVLLITLATGVAPTGVVTGGTSGATATVSGTPASARAIGASGGAVTDAIRYISRFYVSAP